MACKTPLMAALAALSLAACTTVPEIAAPPPTIATTAPRVAPPPPPKPAPSKTKTRTTPRLASSRVTQPTALSAPPPATSINANVTRDADNSLLISRGANTQPVPLFRQAIVLANVRAAVAGLPAQPRAEFQRGLLTLTFPPGSKADVTTAINKALTVPEVTRLRAKLPD
jgi:hypothetical protein